MFNLFKDLFAISAGVSCIPPEFNYYDVIPSFVPSLPNKKNLWSINYTLYNKILHGLATNFFNKNCYYQGFSLTKIKRDLMNLWSRLKTQYTNYIGYAGFTNSTIDLPKFNFDIVGNDVYLKLDDSEESFKGWSVSLIKITFDFFTKKSIVIVDIFPIERFKIGTIIDNKGIGLDYYYMYAFNNSPIRQYTYTAYLVSEYLENTYKSINFYYAFSAVLMQLVTDIITPLNLVSYSYFKLSAVDLCNGYLPALYNIDDFDSIVDNINSKILSDSSFNMYEITLLPFYDSAGKIPSYLYPVTFKISNLVYFPDKNRVWFRLYNFSFSTASWVRMIHINGYKNDNGLYEFGDYNIQNNTTSNLYYFDYLTFSSEFMTFFYFITNNHIKRYTYNFWLRFVIDSSLALDITLIRPSCPNIIKKISGKLYNESRREVLYLVAKSIGDSTDFLYQDDIYTGDSFKYISNFNSVWIRKMVINKNTPIICKVNSAVGVSLSMSLDKDNEKIILGVSISSGASSVSLNNLRISGIISFAEELLYISNHAIINESLSSGFYQIPYMSIKPELLHFLFYIGEVTADAVLGVGSYAIYGGISESGHKHFKLIDVYNNNELTMITI